MKIAKRVLSWLLALSMVLTLLPLGVFAAADNCFRYGRSILEKMSNKNALLYAYDVIEEAAFGTPASISLVHSTYKLTFDEANTVYCMVRYDHPELFWHAGTWNISLNSNGNAAAIKPTYLFTGSALTAAKAELESEIVRLTAGLEGKSDYEKSLILHDRLAAETEYVYNTHDQSAYGALVLGTAVCAGYARAYQMLLQRVGITVWYVTGDSYHPDSGQKIGHAWNLVQLDGEWYYSDPTWDDRKSYVSYAYFNITTAQLLERHIIEYAQYMPTVTATANNYFVRNNLCMDKFSVAAVADVIRNYSPARVYVTGDINTFRADMIASGAALQKELNATAFDIIYGVKHINGHELILAFEATHTCNYKTTTVPATCATSGYRVETCSYEFCHNERNRTVLPATGVHTYDNACDATCNVCGARRSVGAHVYDNACDATCNICGARRSVGAHVYDNACDATCNICGARRSVGAHVYDNACDATCNICGARRSVGAHVYNNACDTTCNVCGAVRSVAPHPYVSKVVTPAGCGGAGLMTYTCSACGDSYTEAIPATGAHTYNNACDTTCNGCGFVRSVEPHPYVAKVTTPATCGANGVKTYTCSACGDSYTEAIPATGAHTYNNACDTTCNGCGFTREVEPHPYVAKVTTPATCGADGVMTYTCSICGDTYTEVIPATGEHTYDNACDTACNGCAFTREVEAHPYVAEVTTPATCGADGVMTYTCSVCGDTYTEVIPATGEHTYDNACDTTCNGCDFTREVEPHPYAFEVATPSSCGGEGVGINTCPICGDTYNETIPATGAHTYDNDCDATCNGCDFTREVEPHPYAFEVATPSSCGGEGVGINTCPICGDTYNETIPATGAHTYDNDCDTVCNGCDFVREVEPHPYMFEVATPSSCGGEGVGINTCPICGDTYNETIPATGEHVYDDACDADCNDCGATRTAPHVYDDPYDADCNLCGITRDVAELKVGDLNGDGRINIRDLGLLQQYLNHWDVFVSLDAADTNDDGKLNIRDLGLLQQYLNHWDVELK